MSTVSEKQSFMPARSTFVALGSSADGAAALVRLMGMLRADTGLTFAVVIDQNTPERELIPRLREQTAMPIVEVSDAIVTQPNHIYVAQPGLDVTISQGRRIVGVPPLDGDVAQCSVDRLFRCLASEFGEAAVGVVLSGSGNDGAIGLKLLKERGGVTVAQIPGESLPDEMSRVAVATGFVDFVLPLDGIAALLGSTLPRAPLDSDFATSDDVLREILVLLRVRTGHDFTHYKRATLTRRVARRMQVTGAQDLQDYLRIARSEPTELASLLRDFLISVTNFFRDPEAFEVFREAVLPRLFEGDPADPIRIWVAGCATGEEAYSFGMLLLEKRAELESSRHIQIFASDIDDDALEEARTARYPRTIAADVSPERLDRFFTREGDSYQVSKELRELVLFASHNVLRDAPFSRLDVMSCRNLLIYLERTMQDNVLRTAHFALRPDRFLFLGSSENADTTEGLFQPFDPKHRLFVRQQKTALVLPSMGPKPRWAPPAFPPVRAAVDLPAQTPGELHHRLVERYAPPSLLVNERLEVSHISQRASRYLYASPGEPSRDLFQMLLPELRLELRAAVYTAKRTPGVAVTCTARAQIHGELRVIRASVQAESTADPANANLLVWFEENDDLSGTHATPSGLGSAPHIEPVVHQLEEELRHTRDQLRTTIEQYETLVEELHASNEELQAINEELRSASEEIEASREETDSVNQELSTVNQELKLRIHETIAAKSDIANLMESSDVGVIFLDRDLRIHRFTQRTREIFNIIDSDVGRPLTDLTPKIEYPTLHADAQRVLQTLAPIDRELRGSNQRSYLAQTRPYRSLDDRIAGVVMTFIDITALRRIEDALRNKEAMLELAERAANAGVWELDSRARLRMSNQCHHLYGTTPSPFALEPDAWTASVVSEERDRLLIGVNAALRSGSDGSLDIEFRVRHPEHGDRWLWMLGRKTDPASDLAGITLDVTAARQARRALEHADGRKNEFIATLAHELRNPLTPLTVGLDILKLAGNDAEQIATARDLMERQVSQLRRLVDDLLDISRIQTGRLELRIVRGLSMSDVIGDAAEAVRPLTNELRHTLVIDAHPGVRVDGDPIRLGQVLVNLLTNAAKYTEPGGTITVSTKVTGNTLSLSVKDTGVGIPPDVMSKIFDVFVQAEPILTRARGGLGIGLSLVRQLVLLHGGTITAHSDGVGKGSCFVVSLPLSKAEGAHE